MDSDQGKLFIGGISWETTEERLKEYFKVFGDIVETIIVRDKNTGRGRGFGFVVFADPVVAESVALERHSIDGRRVEAKKAVPRDEQRSMTRGNSAGPGPVGQSRTRKIFVGGLAQTVTENDFRNYFEQFGTITDMVVMYDHSTQRSRGFGFVTYDSGDAVDMVLQNPFHELNGKMVEVKPSVPRDVSTGYARSPAGGFAIGLGRGNFGAAYVQGYNSSFAGGYGARMNNSYGPGPGGRSGYPSYGATGNGVPGYGTGGGYGPAVNGGYGSPGFGSTSGYGAGNGGSYGGPVGYGTGGVYGPAVNGGYGSTGSRSIPAYGGPAGYGGINAGNGGFGNTPAAGRNMWGGGAIAYGPTGSGGMTGYGGARPWSPAPAGAVHPNGSIVGYARGYGNAESYYGSSGGGYADQNSGNGIGVALYGSASGAYGGDYGDVYGSSGHGDSTQRSNAPDSMGRDSGGCGFGSVIADRSHE